MNLGTQPFLDVLYLLTHIFAQSDGFSTLFTIEPDGDGLEIWKETRWK